MANNAKNVAIGKPKVGGAVFTAPSDTVVPTDATTALDEAYKTLGYVSADGVTNAISTETETIVAWGGDEVLVDQTGRTETFQLQFIETNEETLKLFYGADNVTVEANSIAVLHNNTAREAAPFVFETLLGDRVKRIVVPRAVVSETEDVVHTNGEPVSYGVTLTALADAAGNTAYEYIATIAG